MFSFLDEIKNSIKSIPKYEFPKFIQRTIKFYGSSNYLTDEAHDVANDYFVTGKTEDNALDAFRHAYGIALWTKRYGEFTGFTAGWFNELKNFVKVPISKEGRKKIYKGKSPFDKHFFQAMKMDLYNNKVGREIGIKARNEKELADMVYQALIEGRLISSIGQNPGKPKMINPFDNDSDYIGLPFGEEEQELYYFKNDNPNAETSYFTREQAELITNMRLSEELYQARKKEMHQPNIEQMIFGSRIPASKMSSSQKQRRIDKFLRKGMRNL